MKLYKSPKTLFLFLVIAIFFSCKNDDSGNGNPLIGVWQRSDVSERTDFKLYFNPENTNLATLVGKIDYIYGNGTQFQVAINWSAYPGVLFGINNPADPCSQQINVNSSVFRVSGGVLSEYGT